MTKAQKAQPPRDTPRRDGQKLCNCRECQQPDRAFPREGCQLKLI